MTCRVSGFGTIPLALQLSGDLKMYRDGALYCTFGKNGSQNQIKFTGGDVEATNFSADAAGAAATPPFRHKTGTNSGMYFILDGAYYRTAFTANGSIKMGIEDAGIDFYKYFVMNPDNTNDMGDATDRIRDMYIGRRFIPGLVSQNITAVGNTIQNTATVVQLVANGNYTLTSTPTISTTGAQAGQVLWVCQNSATAGNVTLQDDGTLAGSKLQLVGSGTRSLADNTVVFGFVFTGTYWQLFAKS